MIITNIIGGLGNQMFQYAAGKALAARHGTSLKLATTDFNAYSLHALGLLRLFPHACSTADAATIRQLIGFRAQPYCKRILRKLNCELLNRSLIFEPSFTYWPQFFSLPDNVYLDGYWQSERYFEGIAQQIRADFSFPELSGSLNPALAAKMTETDSVSLHVRRGDYVSHSINHSIYYQCGMDYYRAAISHISTRISKPVYFVFSDDIEWAKDTFADYQIEAFVSHNQGEQSYIDMQLMSMCKHNIIANSTFSWWGAWLNANPGKIVTSPREWFINGRSSQDLIPETWVRI